MLWRFDVFGESFEVCRTRADWNVSPAREHMLQIPYNHICVHLRLKKNDENAGVLRCGWRSRGLLGSVMAVKIYNLCDTSSESV